MTELFNRNIEHVILICKIDQMIFPNSEKSESMPSMFLLLLRRTSIASSILIDTSFSESFISSSKYGGRDAKKISSKGFYPVDYLHGTLNYFRVSVYLFFCHTYNNIKKQSSLVRLDCF